jgi:hypothetical protein
MTGWPSMLTQAPCSEGRLLPSDGVDFNLDLDGSPVFRSKLRGEEALPARP